MSLVKNHTKEVHVRTLRFGLLVAVVLVLLGVSFGSVAAQGDWTAPAYMFQAYVFARPADWTGSYGSGHGGITYVGQSGTVGSWSGRFVLFGLEAGKTYSVRVGSTTLCTFTAKGATAIWGNDGCGFGAMATMPGSSPAFSFQALPDSNILTCRRPTSLTVVDEAASRTVLEGFTGSLYGGFQGYYYGNRCGGSNP